MAFPRLKNLSRGMILATYLCAAAPLLSVDKNWVGGTTDWGTGGNWSPAGVPTTSDSAQFSGLLIGSNPDIGATNRSVGSIVFFNNFDGQAISGTATLSVDKTAGGGGDIALISPGTFTITPDFDVILDPNDFFFMRVDTDVTSLPNTHLVMNGDITAASSGRFGVISPTSVTFNGDNTNLVSSIFFLAGNTTLNITNVNAYPRSAQITVGAGEIIGELPVGYDAAGGGGTIHVTVDGIDMTNTFLLQEALAFDIDGGNTLTVSGSVRGSTTLTKTGAGELELSGTNNLFNGQAVITDGRLVVMGANPLGNGSIALGGTGILEIQGDISSAPIALSGTPTMLGDTVLNGVISGTADLTLAGGDITFGGNNTYSGSISIPIQAPFPLMLEDLEDQDKGFAEILD